MCFPWAPMASPGARAWMPKSDSMRNEPQRGFSLLEVMVVLLIAGIAMGAASVSAFGDATQRTLRQDAQRLAGLFLLAQTQARAEGGRILWRPQDQGFTFERLPRPLVLPARVAVRSSQMRDPRFGAASPLRPRDWLTTGPVQATVQPADALIFGGDWVGPPLAVALRANGHTVQVTRSPAGRYEVRP